MILNINQEHQSGGIDIFIKLRIIGEDQDINILCRISKQTTDRIKGIINMIHIQFCNFFNKGIALVMIHPFDAVSVIDHGHFQQVVLLIMGLT